MAARISIITIRVMGPDLDTYESGEDFDEANEDALSNIDWATIEDEINENLPRGFYCETE